LAGLEAETGGASVALFASFGRRFDIFDWSVVASSELAYVGTRTDAYEEAGVSELRLAFDAYETQSLLAGVRLLGEHTMHLGGRSLRTRLGGGFSHDVALDDRQVNVVFRSTGDRASLDGDDSSRVAVYGLAGVTLDLNHSLALSGDVLLADGDDEPSSVNVGARWRF
jgi:outer membrane autotransporter protein